MPMLFFDSYLRNLIKLRVIKSTLSQQNLAILIFYLLEMPFYAVAVGKIPGIYNTWEECKNQTKGYPYAKFRKFDSEEEASKFVRTKGFQKEETSQNATTKTSSTSVIEIRPEHNAVKQFASRALLKQEKLSLISKKLDDFIDQTNTKLNELSRRLEIVETTFLSGNTSEEKRKNDTTDDDEKGNRSKKKKKSSAVVEAVEDEETLTESVPKRSKFLSKNGSVEELDGPWNVSGTLDFKVDGEGFVMVYTDGACSNNGRQGAKAGVGVWFNHNNPFNVAAPVEGSATNNNAEIQAATRAIEQAILAGVKRLNIHTDSQFMINCMTDWINKWKKNNWMTSNGGPVKNKEQLVMLDNAMKRMDSVKWTHIRGHMGNMGNECADALARTGASMY